MRYCTYNGDFVTLNNSLFHLDFTNIDPSIDKQIYTSYADTSLNSILMPRITQNPITGTVAEIFRIGQYHVTGIDGIIYMRVSSDSGLTWTGVDSSGNVTPILAETNLDLRNVGAFYTPTGRLIVIYMRYQSGTFYDTYYAYSDDDGVSWSTPTTWTDPEAGNDFVRPYSNKHVLDASGNLLYAYDATDSGRTGVRIYIAKSTDDGSTWDTGYKKALDTYGESFYGGELEIADFNDGNFVIICRSTNLNTAGYEVPFCIYSGDYGENWAGASETLNRANLDNGDYNSGYLYFQGPGVTLGGGTAAANCLPDIISIPINGELYIVCPYWIRNNGIETYIEKMSIIKYSDYLANGVSAVKPEVVITLYDGYTSQNGGNGSGIVIGNQILYTNYEQMFVESNNISNLYTFYIDNTLLNAMALNYNLI